MSLQKRIAIDPRIPPWQPRLVTYTLHDRLEHGQFMFLPGQERMKAWMNHVIAEARETKEALGFTECDQLKHWKNKIDWATVDEEMADILHFLLAAWMESVAVSLGTENPEKIAEEIYRQYKKKLEENHARQDRGY